MSSKLPAYKDLPEDKTTGQKTAWGVFDKNGIKDEIGTINLLTSAVVLNAATEIRTGKTVSLNWGLEKIHRPGFGRTGLQHKIVDWREKEGFSFYSYDDEITVNTQAGSQWDGLRHWGHSDTGFYYNGTHHDELMKTAHLGIDHWDKKGGIVGRGVLLDYYSWAERKGLAVDPMSKHAITLADLMAIAEDQHVTFRPGDILLVRTGWVKWYEENNEEQRLKYITNGSAWIGVEGCQETLEWLWDQHFAAVAGDSIGWEAWPPKPGYRLHDHLLSLWGMPIGEMWDLEALSKECIEQQRWTFFLTSAPLNTTGGVASPPNALAVF